MNRPEKIRYTRKPRHTPFAGISRDNSFYQSMAWRDARNRHIRLEPLCRICKRAGKVVDHIQPINAAGAYDTQGGVYGDPLAESNLQTLCERCHNSKSGRAK